ncbi:hypothetical protein M6B22_03830 [Jatrophihabitans cynanchi]|jgi:hypothetical protein|uniref:Uncharacterized protein n=1 Tax=Jatrophihabitans cynanchi TaxID=2944128 RepID=A0ABY7K1P8_9ACTN|nr:hypothetical protein [Jatrophihabitans sp. SB3-54]WAX57900.1 hypothetical protein M6B22_03830 [Jatrophihabitans sp. SB3-54]
MTLAASDLGTGQLVLVIVIALILLSVIAGLIGRELVRRGLREPFVVKLVNRASERAVATVKRPLTVAVLDEVAQVLTAGRYTRSIASALRENHEQIKLMVAEKVKQDPTAGRIGLVPFHDRLIDEVSETTLRVLLELLADPRTDELFSDLLRDNINQLRDAVHEHRVE